MGGDLFGKSETFRSSDGRAGYLIILRQVSYNSYQLPVNSTFIHVEFTNFLLHNQVSKSFATY